MQIKRLIWKHSIESIERKYCLINPNKLLISKSGPLDWIIHFLKEIKVVLVSIIYCFLSSFRNSDLSFYCRGKSSPAIAVKLASTTSGLPSPTMCQPPTSETVFRQSATDLGNSGFWFTRWRRRWTLSLVISTASVDGHDSFGAIGRKGYCSWSQGRSGWLSH